LILLGKRSVAPAIPVQWPLRVGLALTAGLVVGVIEETIFRGFLLGGLLQDWSRFVAVLVSSTLFSATHFLRGNVRVASGLDLDVGLRGLLAHLRPLTQPTVLFPFIGLFLVGIVLAYAYLWTNSLPFAIGLHAGWVFLSKIDGFLLQEQTSIGRPRPFPVVFFLPPRELLFPVRPSGRVPHFHDWRRSRDIPHSQGWPPPVPPLDSHSCPPGDGLFCA
jgi:membrane protease YdiL (CAAX protease family)